MNKDKNFGSDEFGEELDKSVSEPPPTKQIKLDKSVDETVGDPLDKLDYDESDDEKDKEDEEKKKMAERAERFKIQDTNEKQNGWVFIKLL